jgi:hypothetical protein
LLPQLRKKTKQVQLLVNQRFTTSLLMSHPRSPKTLSYKMKKKIKPLNLKITRATQHQTAILTLLLVNKPRTQWS